MSRITKLMRINLFERYFNDLLRENFLHILPYVFAIYPLLGFVDAQMVGQSPLKFILIRCAFLIPILFSYVCLKRSGSSDRMLLHGYTQFVSLGLGVCVVSYLLGGLKSDYYFGLIIVSFLQYTYLPLKPKHGLMLDTFYFITFFTSNTIGFDIETNLIIKQTSNFLSFAIFKFFASQRSQNLIFGSMKRYSLDKELNDNEEVAQIFGELCHLISNPLFISQTLVKRSLQRAKKLDDSDLYEGLDKSLKAHNRISEVVKKMLEFNRSKIGIKSYRSNLVNPDHHPEVPERPKN
ncbi:MAG: hypothetical protein CME60_05830 [Halobacteriovoraceae bacterium]|nr:hypothetical protein [Halobacteriovoraceae bacterium]